MQAGDCIRDTAAYVVTDDIRHDRRKGRPVIRKTMDEDQRWALTSNHIMQGRSARLSGCRCEASGKGLDHDRRTGGASTHSLSRRLGGFAASDDEQQRDSRRATRSRHHISGLRFVHSDASGESWAKAQASHNHLVL